MKANNYKKPFNMNKNLKKAAMALLLFPAMMHSQVDLLVGLNYSYDPPSGCDNKIKNLSVDICNNGSAAAGSFEVGIYLYDPSSSNHWVIDSRTMNSLSGNSCVTISGWNIDMNNYCCLPPAGSNYRIGVWVDTASAVSETNKNNNTSLLAGNITICSAAGVKDLNETMTAFNVFPSPAVGNASIAFTMKQEDKVELKLCDLTGKTLMNVYNGKMNAGPQQISMNLSELSAGIYYLSANTGSGTLSRKIIIQK